MARATGCMPGEETQVHDLLKDILGFTGGILEPEVAAMAVRFLLACAEGAGRPPSDPACSWTTTRCTPAPPSTWRTCWPATPSPWLPTPPPW